MMLLLSYFFLQGEKKVAWGCVTWLQGSGSKVRGLKAQGWELIGALAKTRGMKGAQCICYNIDIEENVAVFSSETEKEGQGVHIALVGENLSGSFVLHVGRKGSVQYHSDTIKSHSCKLVIQKLHQTEYNYDCFTLVHLIFCIRR